ncbi:hypothetical protein VPH35_035366 [Triticum aestivum]
MLGVLACGSVFLALDEYGKPRYYAAIDSLSGLDPTMDLARPSLDPLFNITPSVASRVLYRGAPLTGGTAVQLCIRPRKAAREQSLVLGAVACVSRASGWIPSRPTRLGIEAFVVTLQMPPTHDHVGKIVTCKARRVGNAAALRGSCDSSNIGHYWMPSPKDLHSGA